MKQTLRYTAVILLVVALSNCSDAPQTQISQELTVDQKHELNQLTSKLLISMNETGFFKPNQNVLSNPLEHPTVSDFISRISDEENASTVQKILDHPVFAELNGQGIAVVRRKDDEFQLSQPTQDALTNMSNELSEYLNDFFNSADTLNFNATILAESLAEIVDNAESQAKTISGTSDIEATALLGAFQVQRDLIPSIVEHANSMFQTTPSGGRTQGFFKKLGKYIGSVVVSAAAGAVVGGVIGAIAGGPKGSVIGMAVGAAVGGVIAIYQATQNRCADRWDFQTRIPFVDWASCD